jgi:hypothetical protein
MGNPPTPLRQLATTTGLGLLGAAALLANLSSACAPVVPRIYAQDATIRVESDPGVPLADVPLVYDGKTLAKTAENGRATLRMNGKDGDVFHVGVVCPEGFVAASSVDFDVLVRRGENDGHVPEFATRCARALRRAVVAVRANNGANLPVLHLGREVARTDASGAATIALDVKPGADVEIVLDTRAAKKFHPQNPVLSFKAQDHDDIVVLDQTFTVDKPIVVRRTARGPQVARPLGGAAE